MAAFSTTQMEKGCLVLNPYICPLLVYTTPMVGIGHGSVEELLLLADSHLGLTLLILRRPIFALMSDEDKNGGYYLCGWMRSSAKARLYEIFVVFAYPIQKQSINECFC
jgi:hypothetical protein